MIRRWGLLALGLALIGASFYIQIRHDQRVEWLHTNGTKASGFAEYKSSNRKRTALTVSYSVRESRLTQRVECWDRWQNCPTGFIEIWFDPADPKSIAIPGERLSGGTYLRYPLGIIGLLITIAGVAGTFTRNGPRFDMKRLPSLTPKPGQKPSRRRR